MNADFADNPLEVGGAPGHVQIITKDAQSSPQRAAEVATSLINDDHVDVLLSQASPDITVPVSQQCEINQVLCLSSVTPWQPWVLGMGGNPGDPATAPAYSYHFFFGAEDAGRTFVDMWSQLDTNKKVAALFPNDPDGQAFTDQTNGFPPALQQAGFAWNFPGLYPQGTQDFTSQISSFKASGDDILVGLMPPPDFALAWQQMKQQGYTPKAATVGKATEFPVAVEQLGDLANNLTTGVWWAPQFTTSSSLTGMSSADFAQAYQDKTSNWWNMAMPYTESMFEVLVAAIKSADSVAPDAIKTALDTVKIETLVGPVDFTSGPFPHVAHTNFAGGQWRIVDGKLTLVIVSTVLFPGLTAEDKVQPLS
jgi:branched-chain amino acid transport system substrate-binding protein